MEKYKQQVEEIIGNLPQVSVSEYGHKDLEEYLEQELLNLINQAKEEVLEEVIPIHNARILNEFQKLEDMYERILFRAITKATKDTLTPKDKE